MTSFLKMISVAAGGGTVINYSKRFSLTGMVGTFPPTVLAGLTSVSNTDGPPSQNQIAGQGNRPGADGSFTVPYTLQTGPTRYAPMQPQPMTKIRANQATPLWPTSSVPIAKTWLPPANGIETTMTQTNTFSVASRANDVRWESLQTMRLVIRLTYDPGFSCFTTNWRHGQVPGSMERLICSLYLC